MGLGGWVGKGVVAATVPWIALYLAPNQAPTPDFAKDVAPLFKSKCISCHGPDSASGGLRLDTVAGIKKGGVSGPLFQPFKGDDSLLVHRLLGKDGKPKMPMGFAPLNETEVGKIRAWIDHGAILADPSKIKHWAYTPPVRSAIPPGFGTNPIDAFIRAKLQKEGAKPSPFADRETLARRVALDLTGLPPTVEEIDRFLSDKQPGAYQRYVDRMLASPHYGEHMARKWLDLARYADTNGYEKDLPRQMWAWRDWVINAFNQNLPYDQFTIQQLAGDLLPKPTRDQLVATGFHRNSMLNDEGGIDPEEFRVVAVIDRVDATATTWLGSTIACAQCHDHKYDPFSQKDFYSFFAFFNQSEDNGRDSAPMLPLPNPEQQAAMDKLQAEIKSLQPVLEEKTKSATTRQPAWEARQNGWHYAHPKAKAEGATLSVLDDESILASGKDPEADLYTVETPLGMEPLAGIRIEAIPDKSLPEGSSGRNFNGNFVLHRVEAQVLHADGTKQPITFNTAKADFSQGDFDPMGLLKDGAGLGWAIAGFEPRNRVLHTVSLSLTDTYTPRAGDRLEVVLRHQTKHPNHNLGRFRLSLTSDLQLATQIPPTAVQRAALEKQVRTPDETKTVETYFKASDPELAELRRRVETAQTQYDQLAAMAPTVMVMREAAKPRPNNILKRGDFRTPGDPVRPAVPLSLGGKAPEENRLGLAKWLVNPKNPLTARVEVNRLWEQCFGRGLVATDEDFGTQGEPPSHPELLDWLATELIAKKWDIKALLKEIVTSATYMQSSRVTADMEKKDPYNVLLSRGPRFRVDGETVRDIALTSSGLLSPTIGGPSVMPPQPPGIWENSFSFYDTKDRWVDATGSNRYRRGMYTYWRRTAPYPMAMTFDLKSRDMCVAHRSRTNTPLQALNTLNDPVFVECAGRLGVTMAKKGLEYGFRACTSRTPRDTETAVLRRLLASARQRYASDTAATQELLKSAGIVEKREITADNAAWVVIANTILNLNETISDR